MMFSRFLNYNNAVTIGQPWLLCAFPAQLAAIYSLCSCPVSSLSCRASHVSALHRERIRPLDTAAIAASELWQHEVRVTKWKY